MEQGQLINELEKLHEDIALAFIELTDGHLYDEEAYALMSRIDNFLSKSLQPDSKEFRIYHKGRGCISHYRKVDRSFGRFKHDALKAKQANVEARENQECHDRFLIIDDVQVWHSGNSFNGVGKKAFQINRLIDDAEREKFLKYYADWWNKGMSI